MIESFYIAGTGPTTGTPEFPLLVQGRERAMKIVSDHIGTLSAEEKADAIEFLEGRRHWFRTVKWEWSNDTGWGTYVTIQKVQVVP